MGDKIKVLFVTAEADPFVKVGGLGDVAGSLPKALRSLPPEIAGLDQIDIRVALPLHGVIDRKAWDLKPLTSFPINRTGGPIEIRVFETTTDGVPIYLLDGPMIDESSPVYSTDPVADGMKFTGFSLGTIQLAKTLGWPPDVFHANDWHTAPAVYWLSLNREQDQFFKKTSTLLQVHNLPYLGVGTQPALLAFDLPPQQEGPLPDWARYMPMPLGLLTADHIVTVSPGYAEEILTQDYGSGLHEFLQTRSDSISGILNGLDLEWWNPAVDAQIHHNYSSISLGKRAQNKTALQAELRLPPDPKKPLIAMVTRMDYQKGVDLALDALRKISDLDWQAVILGTGDPYLEEAAKGLGEEFSDRIQVEIRYNAPLSRRIYAGSDMLLIPSRYEPCGLTQMIAMVYGCVPVARATGGLRDTISDYHDEKNGTGFLFYGWTADDFASTLRRALEVYSDKRRWAGLQRRGMRQDFSWKRSAADYLALYRQLKSLR